MLGVELKKKQINHENDQRQNKQKLKKQRLNLKTN